MSNNPPAPRTLYEALQCVMELRERMAELEWQEAEHRKVVASILEDLPGKSYTCDIAHAKMIPESFSTAYNVDIIERGIAMLLSKGLVVEAQLFSAGREERKRNAYPSIRKPATKKEPRDA